MSLSGCGRVQKKQGSHHQSDGFGLFDVARARVSLIYLGQLVDFFSAVTFDLCSTLAELYDHDGYK